MDWYLNLACVLAVVVFPVALGRMKTPRRRGALFGVAAVMLAAWLAWGAPGNVAVEQHAALAQEPPAATATDNSDAAQSAGSAEQPDGAAAEASPAVDAAGQPSVAAEQPSAEAELAAAEEAPAEEAEPAPQPLTWSTLRGQLWFQVVVVLAMIAISLFAGWSLSTRFRMPDYSFKISLVLGCFLVATAVTVLRWPPKLGIDLSGGVVLVYDIMGKVETGPAGADAPEADDQDAAEEDQDDTRSLNKQEMDKLIAAVKNRVDPGGVKEVTIRQFGADQIEIIVPRADTSEVDRLKRLLGSVGTLEFRILANNRDHQPRIERAQAMSGNVLRDDEGNALAWWVPVTKGQEGEFDTMPNIARRGRTLPNGTEILEVLVVNDRFNVNGSYLVRSSENIDAGGQPCVDFVFNARGGQLFSGLTGNNLPDEAQEFYRHLGIILDGNLYSAPRIDSQIHAHGQITGGFSRQDVDDLVAVLNAGSLPSALSPEPARESVIGPTLGQDTVRKGQMAILISFIAVPIFMIFYYRFPGIVATMALVGNVVMLLAIMITVHAAFTLPGIAGLVLTVGMAVDANVLIFERIREELDRQAALRMAIRNGFSRAMSAIIDSNLTTLITAVILYVIGTDQVRGFAVTLFLGVVLSMFTAIYCSRVVFDIAERRKWITRLKMTRILGGTNFDFLSKRRVAAVISCLLIVLGLVAVVSRGKGLLDIDFTGGVSVEVQFTEPETAADVRAALAELPDLAVNSLQIEDEAPNLRYMVNTSLPPDTESDAYLAEVETKIADAFGDKLVHYSMTVSDVGPVVADEAPAAEQPAVTAADNRFAGGTQAALEFEHAVDYNTLSRMVGTELEAQGRTDVDFQLFNEKYVVGDETAYKNWSVQLQLPEDEARPLLTAIESRLESTPVFPSASGIGGKVAVDTQIRAVIALLASCIFIVGYLWVRFQHVMYGLAAVVALVHDALITLGALALSAYVADYLGFLLISDFKIGLSVLAGILTLIGYSVNDTIVVFDRIREVKGKSPNVTEEMINRSINQTLSRTILTSFTTWLVVVILYIGGGQGIHAFAFSLVIGVIVGTYSSVYVASPILIWMSRPPKAA